MLLLASDSFNLLAINPGLVFWTVVTFLTVLGILWRFAWNPIVQAMDARNNKIESELKESQRLSEEAEELLKDYEAKIEKAEQESLEFAEKGKREAERSRERILREAEEKSKEMLSRAEKEIGQAKIAAVQEIQEGIVNTTIQIISKILKVDVGDEEHRSLIVDELKKSSLLKK